MSKRERDFKRNFNLIYPGIRNTRQVAFATREEISLSPAAEAYPVFWRGLPTRSLYNHCVMRIHDNIISGSPEESETSLLHARRIHVHHVPRFLSFFFLLLPPFRHSCSSTTLNLLKGMTWKIQFPEKNEKILFRLDFNFPLSLFLSLPWKKRGVSILFRDY